MDACTQTAVSFGGLCHVTFVAREVPEASFTTPGKPTQRSTLSLSMATMSPITPGETPAETRHERRETLGFTPGPDARHERRETPYGLSPIASEAEDPSPRNAPTHAAPTHATPGGDAADDDLRTIDDLRTMDMLATPATARLRTTDELATPATARLRTLDMLATPATARPRAAAAAASALREFSPLATPRWTSPGAPAGGRAARQSSPPRWSPPVAPAGGAARHASPLRASPPRRPPPTPAWPAFFSQKPNFFEHEAPPDFGYASRGPLVAYAAWRPSAAAALLLPPSWAPMPVSPALTNLSGLYRKRVQQRTLFSPVAAYR
ncbi:hypothetical protein M885DRAFT_526946 [Pelagophyceae sp. CCMP2097]|nr:hypothetical protein M885DRAFT_526946 [Pelagophyceae sp. CCMP2097]